MLVSIASGYLPKITFRREIYKTVDPKKKKKTVDPAIYNKSLEIRQNCGVYQQIIFFDLFSKLT